MGSDTNPHVFFELHTGLLLYVHEVILQHIAAEAEFIRKIRPVDDAGLNFVCLIFRRDREVNYLSRIAVVRTRPKLILVDGLGDPDRLG
jgi:hypothetical protein